MPFRLGDSSGEGAPSEEDDSSSPSEKTIDDEDDSDKEEEVVEFYQESEWEEQEVPSSSSSSESSVKPPPFEDEGEEMDNESCDNDNNEDAKVSPSAIPKNSNPKGNGKIVSRYGDTVLSHDNGNKESNVSSPDSPSKQSLGSLASGEMDKPKSYELPGLNYGNKSDPRTTVSSDTKKEKAPAVPPRRSPTKRQKGSVTRPIVAKPLPPKSTTKVPPSQSAAIDKPSSPPRKSSVIKRLKADKSQPSSSPPKSSVVKRLKSPIKTPDKTSQTKPRKGVNVGKNTSSSGRSSSSASFSSAKEEKREPNDNPNVNSTVKAMVTEKSDDDIISVKKSSPTESRGAPPSPKPPDDIKVPPKPASDSSFSFSSDTDPSLAAKLATANIGYAKPMPLLDEKRVSFQAGVDKDENNDDDSFESYETASSDEFETDTEENEEEAAPLPHPLPRYDGDPVDETSEYETDTTYEKEARSATQQPTKPPMNPLIHTSTGSVALGSGQSLLPNQMQPTTDTEKPQGRRKPFENIPPLIDADATKIRSNYRNDEESADVAITPLGLAGWEAQNALGEETTPLDKENEQVQSGDGPAKKAGLFGWLFEGDKKRKDPSLQSQSSAPKVMVQNHPKPRPVYVPPEYDDGISEVTDRIFFPKKTNPPPRREENPDHPQMTPSELEREIQEREDRFSIRSFRRKNVRHTDRALESLDPVSVLTTLGDSEPRQYEPQNEKRSTQFALAGLPALSVRKDQNLSHDVGGTRRDPPGFVKAALIDMKSESVDLDIRYDLEEPITDFGNGPADPYHSRTIIMNEGLCAIPENGGKDTDENLGGIARTESMENEEFEEEEIIFEEEFEEKVEEPEEKEEVEDMFLEDPEQHREIPEREWKEQEKEQDRELGMSFTTRSTIYCLLLVFLVATLGVGIWLILKYIVFDESSLDPAGGGTPSSPPSLSPPTATGPSFGDTPPALPPTIAPTTPEEVRQELVDTLSPFLPDGGQNFEDPESPQSQAISWMSGDPAVYSYDGEKLVTRYALATLYYSTNGDDWINNDLWLSDEDECLWYSSSGLDPCSNGRFVQLRLGDNNLQGVLPEELSLLSNTLTAIDLGGVLVSKLPWAIGELQLLTSLRLRGNQLSGELPESMNALTKLSYLDLKRNKLKGTISSDLMTSLSSLGTMDLSENQFEGQLPGTIGRQNETLTWLSLASNQITGPVPDEICANTLLTYLSLDSNGFQSLPTSIDLLTQLETLSANSNLLQGELPESITRLTNLKGLYLNNNEYTGRIPESYGSLTSLEFGLDLSGNMLTGPLPESLGQVSRLKILDLRNNMLTGTVPVVMGALSILDLLRLDANNFVGELPVALCDSFDETSSSYYTDCRELSCPCCNFCCDDVTGECTCRFANSQPILCIP